MAVITKVALKNINPELLLEQIPGGILLSTSWAGFHKLGARMYEPNAARQEIGYSSATGPDFADPGEIRFLTSRDLTPAENTQLDSILAAHQATQLTAEQVRQDQDEADLDSLIAADRAAYTTAIQTIQASVNAINTALTGWDAANTAATKQKTEDSIMAMRDALVALRSNDATVGKILRYIIRKERGTAI